MSTEEANRSEQILEEQLASVQERKKELTAIINDSEPSDSEPSDSEKHSEDASQPSDSEKHNKGASQPSNSEKQNEDASETSDSEKHKEDAPQSSYSEKLKKDAPQPSDSEKVKKSAPQPSDSEKLKKDALQPSDSEKFNEDATQLSDSLIGAENKFSKPLEEVQLAKSQKQPYEDSYNNNQHKSPRVESSRYRWTDQHSPLQNILVEDTTLQLQQAGPSSYTSLLTAADVTETLFPTRETVISQSPVQNVSSLQQNQMNLFRDDVFDTHSYSNWNSTGFNQPPGAPQSNDQSTYGTASGFQFLNPQSNDLRTYGTANGSQFSGSQSNYQSTYGNANGFQFLNPKSNDLRTYGTANGSQLPNSQSNDLSTYGSANGFQFSNPQSYDLSTYGTASGFQFPKSSLTSPNLQPPSLPAGFQVPPHQIQFPVQASNYYQISQPMPQGSSRNVSLFCGPQWSNVRNMQPNATSFRQKPSLLDLPNSVSGLNNMYSDSGSSALFSRPSDLQMNLQSMGGQNDMWPSLSLNLQGPYSDYYHQQPQLELQGSSSAPKVNVYNYNEQQGSSSAPKVNVYNYNDQQGSSSAPKRKLSWDDDDIDLRLSSYHQDENAAYTNNTILPAPRHPANAIYNTEYELMGLPVDPYLRSLFENPENDDGNPHQEYP